MKNVLILTLLLFICSLGCWLFFGFSHSDLEQPHEGISFYEVQLVCNAANDIGCGSRSKPILLDLEKETSIGEAWLNRSGTVVAVVWDKDHYQDTRLVRGIFKSHDKSMSVVKRNQCDTQLESFDNDRWYKGAEVDELSKEEAGRIASQIVDPLISGGILSEEKGESMLTEVESYIQHEFEILEDVSLLSTTSYYDNWEKEIELIMGKYLPENQIPKLEMCKSSTQSYSTNSKSCCSESCCKSTTWFSKLFR